MAVGVLGFFLASALPAAADAVPTAAIDSLVKEALQSWEVPGAAVAIVRDDQVIYLKGHGVKELGKDVPVTPDTVFPIGSCTKAFTTAAMALLVDDGKMHWDDPVRKHLPFFRLADPLADASVTLRDLVTHRTGVASHDLLWYRAPWSAEERVRRVGLLPLDRPFRTTFQYQSVMFTAAGLAVGNAAQSSWADFVQKRLLKPLGMTGASLTTTAAEKAPDRASPHRRVKPGQIDVIRWYPMEEPDPAGSLNASAADLAKWLRFQLGDGTFDGKRLVSAEGLGETHTPQIVQRLEGATRAYHPETNQMSYGMGWVIQDYRGRLLVSHAGAIDGFRAHITLVPKAKLGIVLLNNLDQTRMNLALSNSLVDLLLGLPGKDWNRIIQEAVKQEAEAAAAQQREREAKRHHGTKPSHELAAYAGAYEHPAYGTARVSVKNGGLVLEWGSFTCPLEHFHYDTFTALNPVLGNAPVVFTLGADGEVATMKVLGPMNAQFTRGKRPAAKR
jgi:CubicO group peptidase (beta-lactamase class C family)